MHKKTIVIHSGGMDSSLCLALAIKEFDCSEVLSLSFDYAQRHENEMIQARKICNDWNVDHVVIPLHCLQEITDNALMNKTSKIKHENGKSPNTLVVGRNGLMARLGAVHAQHIGASSIYMGIIEVENSNYRDCSREYIDKVQDILRIDLDDKSFEIHTPIVYMTKKETMILGYKLGILEYLLKETISCYNGIPLKGCQKCPACKLRNDGIEEFLQEFPDFKMPFYP